MEAGVEKMNQLPGIRVTKVSSFYETEPVGGPPQPMYLNAVAEIECSLSARELLRHLQRIENELGRKREGKDFPRTIDLDILFFGNQVIDEPDLKVPHPRLHERSFVLDPLNEIAPEVVHPVLRVTVETLRKGLLDNKGIE
jgi:2-amino-4-hydroxy-6-hydroxymethyldihydropteridine diphosphokinase